MLKDAGKLRIVHVVLSLEPGGMENGVVNVSNNLDDGDFETEIVCLNTKGAFVERLKKTPVRCLDKGTGFSWKIARELGKVFSEIEPDVIHTHNLGPLICAVLGRICSRCRCPILHGEHSAFRESDMVLKRRFQRAVLYRFCRKVHAVSRGLRDHMEARGVDSKKLCFVPNGVDCERFRPAGNMAEARSLCGFPGESIVIGMVGRLVPWKRHLMMLEAFEQVAAKQKRARLLFLGDSGSEAEAIGQAIEDHPYRDRIIWGGFRDDMVSWYQGMNLLAAPSSNEGLSNALLEAMACGVPCLAHTACGAADVITDGENGMLRDFESSDQLAKGILEMTSSPEGLQRLSVGARMTVEKFFSLDAMVQGYARLYRDVAVTPLSSGNPRSRT